VHDCREKTTPSRSLPVDPRLIEQPPATHQLFIELSQSVTNTAQSHSKISQIQNQVASRMGFPSLTHCGPLDFTKPTKIWAQILLSKNGNVTQKNFRMNMRIV